MIWKFGSTILLFLTGTAGTGKSHLPLHSCQLAGSLRLAGNYLWLLLMAAWLKSWWCLMANPRGSLIGKSELWLLNCCGFCQATKAGDELCVGQFALGLSNFVESMVHTKLSDVKLSGIVSKKRPKTQPLSPQDRQRLPRQCLSEILWISGSIIGLFGLLGGWM